MPTVRDDITLSQLSYLDDLSELDGNSLEPAQKDLAGRWQDMQAQGWEYLGDQNYFADSSTNNIPKNGFQA